MNTTGAAPGSQLPRTVRAPADRPTPERADFTGNALLDALPGRERHALLDHAQLVPLGARDVVLEPERPIEHVYFPLSGVVSLASLTRDGFRVNVASIGREGMAGLPVFLGAGTTPNLMAVIQVPGEAIRIPAGEFDRQSRTSAPLDALMRRYTNSLIVQATQEVACNRRHGVTERTACWLLLTMDRVGGPKFPLTQQFLAELLGTRRASIVNAQTRLQKAGAIQYRRGRMLICDPVALESFACDCYRIIRDSFHPHVIALPDVARPPTELLSARR